MNKCAAALSLLLLTSSVLPSQVFVSAAEDTNKSSVINNINKTNSNEIELGQKNTSTDQTSIEQNDAGANDSTSEQNVANNKIKPQPLGDPISANKLTLSGNQIGTDLGVDQITATFKFSVKKGDVAVIKIPRSIAYTVEFNSLASSAGTTTRTENNDYIIITNTFKVAGSFSQIVNLKAGTPYAGVAPVPNKDNKLTEKTITWTMNDVDQESASFNALVSPKMYLKPVTRVHVKPNNEGFNVQRVFPNIDYDYLVNFTENTGVTNTTGSPANRVNSSANYGGTTIQVPVPPTFVLNEELTKSTNNYLPQEDGTTITQPGGPGTNVIIDVPAGKGTQNYQGQEGYHIVGHYTITQTNTDQVINAPGKIVAEQIINADGDKIKTELENPWQETIAPRDIKEGEIGLSAVNNNQNGTIVKDDDPTNDPKIVNYFGFTNNSAFNLTDANIELKIADGLNANSIKLPSKSGKNYTLTLNKWTYDLTLANGDHKTGTANPGDIIQVPEGLAIRKAVLKPDFIGSGAGTDNIASSATRGDYGPTLQNNNANEFIVYGNLSQKYDDGREIQIGDKLKSEIRFTTSTLSNNVFVSDTTQTVIGRPADLATIAVGGGQTNLAPGNKDAGFIYIGKYYASPDDTVTKIFEPVLYFVLPKATVYTGSYSVVDGDPKVTAFTADDGRQIVKVDYTGTGIGVNTQVGTAVRINVDNQSDAVPGDYPFEVYMISKTNVHQTQKVTEDKLSYTEGNRDAIKLGDGNFKITAVEGFFATSFVQGNEDSALIDEGHSIKSGAKKMTLAVNILNLTPAPIQTPTSIINLPQKSNSSFQFNLTKNGVELPAGADEDDYEVLYSTKLADLTKEEPDSNGYVSAENVTDWSKIKSIYIKKQGLSVNQTTGRILIHGTDQTLLADGGKTGKFEVMTYVTGKNPILSDNNLTIHGESTVKARFHYIDQNGQDKYIYVDTLKKTLKDGIEKLDNDYLTRIAAFNDQDKKLIPKGYVVQPDANKAISIKTDTKKDFDGLDDKLAKFGDVSQYYFDNDVVQIELVRPSEITVHYVNKENGVYKEIKPTTQISGFMGDEYQTKSIIIPGYKSPQYSSELSSDTPEKGKFKFDNQHVYYVYDKLPTKPDVRMGQVITHFVDRTHTEIDKPTTLKGKVGKGYEAKPKAIPGFKLVGYSAKLSSYTPEKSVFTNSIRHVYYVYDKLPTKPDVRMGQVITHYVDRTHTEIVKPTTLKGEVGEGYEAKPKAIPGFKLVGYSAKLSSYTPEKSVFTNSIRHVYYVYDKLPTKPDVRMGQVITHFVDRTHTELVKPTTLKGEVGEGYEAKPKAIPGYKLVGYSAKLSSYTPEKSVFTNSIRHVYYVYDKLPTKPDVRTGRVVTHYIDRTHTELQAQSILTSEIGDDYKVIPKAIPGYKFVGYSEKLSSGKEEGQFKVNVQHIYYVYDKLPTRPDVRIGRVITHYVNQFGFEISEIDVQQDIVGEGYTTSPKKIKGYNLLGLDEKLSTPGSKETGIFKDVVQHVYYVYYSAGGSTILPPVDPDNPDSKPNPDINPNNPNPDTNLNNQTPSIETPMDFQQNLKNPISNSGNPNNQSGQLPQTNEKNETKSLTILGAVLAIGSSILLAGLWVARRRKK